MSATTTEERPLLEFDAERGEARISLDEGIYPLPAIFTACHAFLDRLWLVVERPDAAHHAIVLTPKERCDPRELQSAAGALVNELLCCAYRHTLTHDRGAAVEAIATQAISGAMGPASLEELGSFDFGGESFEDPLGIAAPQDETPVEEDT